MISKSEILATWDKMKPLMQDAPAEIKQRFISGVLESASRRCDAVEMDYASLLLGLASMLPGELTVTESNVMSTITSKWFKGGVALGSISRYETPNHGQAFTHESIIDLTAVGTALIETFNPDVAISGPARKLILDQAGVTL